jgi:predicted dehydrogenase
VTVRVGFLGGGLIAWYHALSLQASGTDHTVVAVHDPKGSKRATRFAEHWGACVAVTEEAVLDACDAVYVCTWTSEHPRLVAAACERGLSVFCEKPLATDLAGARSMTEAVAAAGVVNQVGLVLRRAPAFGLARALVADVATSGRPMAVVFRDDQYLPTQGMYRSSWRGDPTKAGSGVLLEHSIHDLDMIEFVFGRVASVSAMTTDLHEVPGIEDGVVVTMRFASGAVGTLTSVWHDVLERESNRRVELFTERCAVVLEDDTGPVAYRVTGSDEVRVAGDELIAEAAARGADVGNPDGAFIDAVTTGTPASPSFDDALRAHVLVDAVYRSAAAGGAPVDVPA